MTKKLKRIILAALLWGSGSLALAAPTTYIQSRQTLQSGTTFYVSSGTVQNVVISTLSWIAQPSSGTFAAERCAREVQFSVTTGSSTSVGAFVPTNLSGTITPHSTASYIKIKVVGDTANTAGSTPVNLTIFRNGVNIGPASGLAKLSGSGTTLTNVVMFYDDTPATVNPITYAVAMQTSGGTMSFCNSSLACVLTLQECF